MNLRQVVLLRLSACNVHADAVAYGGRHEVTARNGTYTFHHVHDWNGEKVSTLFSEVSMH